MTDLPVRFWEKVNKTDTCWLWTAATNARGYGVFRFDGRVRRAHRLVYETVHGVVAPGSDIDHTCHATLCVNPAHLVAVSHQQNTENRRGANSNGASGVRGVHRRGNKWAAGVRSNGRHYSGGVFTSIEEAEIAAVALRNKLMTHSLSDQRATIGASR